MPRHIAEIRFAVRINTVLFGGLIKLYYDQSVCQYIGFDTFDIFTNKDLVRDRHLDKARWKDNT